MSDKVSASHILIMHKESKDSRSDLTKQQAKKKIQEIHKKILDKKAEFKDMAVKNSDCSSAPYGGNLGEFGKGVMVPIFEEKAFSLKVNEISEPIESDFGFHIIQRHS